MRLVGEIFTIVKFLALDKFRIYHGRENNVMQKFLKNRNITETYKFYEPDFIVWYYQTNLNWYYMSVS